MPGKLSSIIFVVALIASSSLFSHSVRAAPSSACSLLTASDVSNALGVSVGAGMGSMPKLCQWREQVKPGEPNLIADLNGPDSKLFNNTRSLASVTGATITPVGGLGDEAYFYYKKAGSQVIESIWFRKGDSAFNIRVWGGKKISDTERETKEQALAKIVLSKL